MFAFSFALSLGCGADPVEPAPTVGAAPEPRVEMDLRSISMHALADNVAQLTDRELEVTCAKAADTVTYVSGEPETIDGVVASLQSVVSKAGCVLVLDASTVRLVDPG